jgi:hypothetical protein
MKCLGPIILLSFLVACSSWQVVEQPAENGVTMRELACAHAFYVGEPSHSGMPLVPMNPASIERVRRRLERAIPKFRAVDAIADADIVISVVFAPSSPVTTHAPPKPDTEWAAVIERGGPAHKNEYAELGPYINFNGRMSRGTDAVGGFVKQLAAIRAAHPCGRLTRGSARGSRSHSPECGTLFVVATPTSGGLVAGDDEHRLPSTGDVRRHESPGNCDNTIALAACTSSGTAQYVYFPELAARVQAGDTDALEELLVLADATSPGARLEELARLVSLFVRPSPSAFLRAQASRQDCFGVDFLGDAYVDNNLARSRELEQRRQALARVTDADLVAVKARCLAKLSRSDEPRPFTE